MLGQRHIWLTTTKERHREDNFHTAWLNTPDWQQLQNDTERITHTAWLSTPDWLQQETETDLAHLSDYNRKKESGQPSDYNKGKRFDIYYLTDYNRRTTQPGWTIFKQLRIWHWSSRREQQRVDNLQRFPGKWLIRFDLNRQCFHDIYWFWQLIRLGIILFESFKAYH